MASQRPPWFDDLTCPALDPFKQTEEGPLGDIARAAADLQANWRVYAAEDARRKLAEAVYSYLSGRDNQIEAVDAVAEAVGIPAADLRKLFMEARDARKGLI